MRKIINAITDKPDWPAKVRHRVAILNARWFSELNVDDYQDVSYKMLCYLDEELWYIAELFEETGMVSVYDGDIVKSDSAIPDPLKTALQAAAARLEDVPESEKDWQPHTDGRVLDLVDPSLFPVIFGRTLVVADGELSIEEGLARSGHGEILPALENEPGHDETDGHLDSDDEEECSQYSHNYQWLPCEVKFKPIKEVNNGEEKESFRCEIASYINNLHPHDHRELYGLIEQILTRAIPLWNATLGPLRRDKPPKRIEYDGVQYTVDFDNLPEFFRLDREDDEDEDSYFRRQLEWEHKLEKATLILPEPGKFQRPKNCSRCEEVPPIVKLQEEYAEQGLQVIVKMANIHLAPEKPEYQGGTWHIEGQLVRDNCLCHIYNLTTHRRTNVSAPRPFTITTIATLRTLI